MGIVEDVIKALERIPAWKRLSALPAELDALRTRIAALEERLSPAVGDTCPRCRAMAFRLIESRPEKGPMGQLGARVHVFRCASCQYEDVRPAQAAL